MSEAFLVSFSQFHSISISPFRMQAKHNIAEKIHAGDTHLSQWILEREESDKYGEKFIVKHSGTTEGELHPEDEETRKKHNSAYLIELN